MTTILLVEDDPFQAFVRMSALEKRFPQVKRVVDAAEALCLIEQQLFSDNLGLVIAGDHFHGLTGPDFVAELHARKPGLPVLVLGDTQETARDYTGENIRFLSRPAVADEIVSAATQMLTEDGHKVA
jgi:DNA-binding NtrC family response regulator